MILQNGVTNHITGMTKPPNPLQTEMDSNVGSKMGTGAAQLATIAEYIYHAHLTVPYWARFGSGCETCSEKRDKPVQTPRNLW